MAKLLLTDVQLRALAERAAERHDVEFIGLLRHDSPSLYLVRFANKNIEWFGAVEVRLRAPLENVKAEVDATAEITAAGPDSDEAKEHAELSAGRAVRRRRHG